MKPIRIVKLEQGYEVIQDGKTSGQLNWDEMLGLVANLTHWKLGEPQYAMRTKKEWRERSKAAFASLKQNRKIAK